MKEQNALPTAVTKGTMRIPVRWTAAILILALFSVVTSCKKTEKLPLEEISRNKILEFKVINSAEEFLGAIDQVKNTITVYIPYHSGIEFMVPAIKLEAGAKLIDANGNEINLDGGLEPVAVSDTEQSYTVLGHDAVKRKYKLITEIQPFAQELVAGYKYDNVNKRIDVTTSSELIPGAVMQIFGNFESTSTNIKLTAKNRKTGNVSTDVFTVSKVITTTQGFYIANVNIAADADTGVYDIDIESQGRKAKLAPYRLFYRKPYFGSLLSAATTLHAGDTLTLKSLTVGQSTIAYSGVNVGLKKVYLKFNKARLYSYPAALPDNMLDTKIELQIIESSFTYVKVKIPENMPVGTYEGSISASSSIEYGYVAIYGGLEFYFDYEDWTGYGTNQLLGIGYSLYVLPKDN